MSLASKLFKGDRVIWIIFMFLCLISAGEGFSATSTLAISPQVIGVKNRFENQSGFPSFPFSVLEFCYSRFPSSC